MRISNFGGYCHESELASRAGRSLAVNGLPKNDDGDFKPGDPKDQTHITNSNKEGGEYDWGFKLMGGLVLGGAGGAVAGAIGGSALGARYGHPVLGTVAGLAVGGVGGGVLGAVIGGR